MTTTEILTNGVARLEFIDALDHPLYAELKLFLAPHFWPAPDGAPAQLHIQFRAWETFPESIAIACRENVVIRESSAAAFNLHGLGLREHGNLTAVWCPEQRTGYRLSPSDNHIVFYASMSSRIHLVELVRYAALLIEEAHGSVLLHASAALADGRAFLVLGSKGAGKTSTLLRLVLGGEASQLAGDKVLLSADEGGELMIRGWPDYPHVGLGTLRQFPALLDSLVEAGYAESGGADTDKVLIPPEVFAKHVPAAECSRITQVAAILLPNVRAVGSRVEEVATAEKGVTALLPHIEYPHEFRAATWHGLLSEYRVPGRAANEALLRKLTTVAWYRLHGPVVQVPGLAARP